MHHGRVITTVELGNNATLKACKALDRSLDILRKEEEMENSDEG